MDQMATGVRAALDRQKQTSHGAADTGKSFRDTFAPAKNASPARTIDSVLGTKGQANNGMFKVVIGREVKMPCGCMMTKEMGANTWASFAGTDDNAVVDGDLPSWRMNCSRC
jgi:hypothetical protein